MKKYLLALACFSVVSMNAAFAAETSEVNLDVAHHSTWHCTAYDPHGHGYSVVDEHYSHAYNGAVNKCERSSGHHCHDVHCHVDNH